MRGLVATKVNNLPPPTNHVVATLIAKNASKAKKWAEHYLLLEHCCIYPSSQRFIQLGVGAATAAGASTAAKPHLPPQCIFCLKAAILP